MDYLAQSDSPVPLLVLASARPEVTEVVGPGAGFVAAAAHVPLGPLSGEETAELARARLGAKSLPTDLQALILERSGGNPFFAEELVRLLQDRALLETHGGKVALKPGAEVPLPDSIGALIAARLELLSPERKALLADAAVVGRSFWAGAVAAVGTSRSRRGLRGLLRPGRQGARPPGAGFLDRGRDGVRVRPRPGQRGGLLPADSRRQGGQARRTRSLAGGARRRTAAKTSRRSSPTTTARPWSRPAPRASSSSWTSWKNRRLATSSSPAGKRLLSTRPPRRPTSPGRSASRRRRPGRSGASCSAAAPGARSGAARRCWSRRPRSSPWPSPCPWRCISSVRKRTPPGRRD